MTALTAQERERRRLEKIQRQVDALPDDEKAGRDAARRARLEELRRAKLDQAERARKASPKRPPHSDRVRAKLLAAQEAKTAAEMFTQLGKTAAAKDKVGEARRLEREAWEMDREDLEQAWRDGAISETVWLATLRGEEVDHETVDIPMEVRDEHGAKVLHKSGPLKGQPIIRHERVTRTILKDRGGGLDEAYEKGWLDPEHDAQPTALALRDFGLKYREAYEIEEGQKSNAGGEGGGGFGPKGPQLRIVEAGEFMAITRGALTSRQRRVVDLVCGQDLRCRKAADTMGANRFSVQKALRAGLQAALAAWEDAKERKEVGHAAHRAKRAARAMRGL